MKRRSRTIPALALLLSLASVFGCRARPPHLPGPAGPPVPEELVRKYVSQGDENFQSMHLYGWRHAEEAYAAAFNLAPNPEIRSRLAMTRLLRMTREIDEDIPCPSMEEDIRFICGEPSSPRATALCDLALAYAADPSIIAAEMKRVPPETFDTAASPLDAYLFTLCTRTFGSGSEEDALLKHLKDTYRDSPLFLYLNADRLGRSAGRFPDFSEAWEYGAEMNLQAKLVKAARSGFEHALALVHDYTRAVNGLANVFFFILEDYVGALKIYERTLRLDPKSTAALFGTGAALHHLDRYDESNAAMDAMLATDLSRHGRVAADNVRYYRGEAYYYKAYNEYLKKNPHPARELIDLALEELPRSEEIHYLSGLLYYHADDLDAAEADFRWAVQTGGNCYAYHYLGMIEHRRGGEGAAAQFLSSSSCLERGLRRLQAKISSLDGLDIEPAERAALQTRMEKKLLEYRDSSTEVMRSMIGLVRGSDLPPEPRKSIILDAMTGLLDKVISIQVQ